MLKCKWKPTRQSLSLESCQCLRHLPINRTTAVFRAAGVYFSQQLSFFSIFFSCHYTIPLENHGCVPACVSVPHWSSKWQAGSIATDLIARWRDEACDDAWRVPENTTKGAAKQKSGDEGAAGTSSSGWRMSVGSCANFLLPATECWRRVTDLLMTADIIWSGLLNNPSKQIWFPLLNQLFRWLILWMTWSV